MAISKIPPNFWLYNNEKTVLSHFAIEEIRQRNKAHRNVGEGESGRYCRETIVDGFQVANHDNDAAG
jgi:hypothetical protein